MKEASKLHIIVSSDQKAAEFLDNVKNQAVWDMEVDKEITVYEEEILLLKENWTLMREEALVLMKNVSIENGWLSFPKTYNISGNWSEYPLFTYGAKRHHHCGSAPETCKILKSFPASSKFKRGTVKFIAIQPETKLFGFHGPTNAVLRAHLGLQMPSDGAEKAVLQVGKHHQLQLNEGHTVIFDNSFDRTYINHSSKEPILLLSFDIPNPDLSQDMKQMSYTLGLGHFLFFSFKINILAYN
ncbi:Uncharacterized protein FKW44_003473 [Caligus rogercresseyi]|uniref:Aspartyl/asparaginy/proline hydroxylase domain-containing protein n=1 Tax=Caligus rogercresseyi TaxID=217165 RepID=A0A7T8KLQ4_CALRO|nr:Uncharacterized protein FKW44_003473 [Caligus rogercresseyi]